MDWNLMSAEEMHAAQIITGVTMGAIMLSGFCGRHAQTVRLTAAGLYFAAVALFVGYILIR